MVKPYKTETVSRFVIGDYFNGINFEKSIASYFI